MSKVSAAADLVERVLNGQRPTFDKKTEQEYPKLTKLMKDCWSQNPNDRPSFEEIVLFFEELEVGLRGRDRDCVAHWSEQVFFFLSLLLFSIFYFLFSIFYFLFSIFYFLFSILFYFILFHSISFCFILFHSISFYFILFYSILFYFILFYSILFYFILFYSISLFTPFSHKTTDFEIMKTKIREQGQQELQQETLIEGVIRKILLHPFVQQSNGSGRGGGEGVLGGGLTPRKTEEGVGRIHVHAVALLGGKGGKGKKKEREEIEKGEKGKGREVVRENSLGGSLSSGKHSYVFFGGKVSGKSNQFGIACWRGVGEEVGVKRGVHQRWLQCLIAVSDEVVWSIGGDGVKVWRFIFIFIFFSFFYLFHLTHTYPLFCTVVPNPEHFSQKKTLGWLITPQEPPLPQQPALSTPNYSKILLKNGKRKEKKNKFGVDLFLFIRLWVCMSLRGGVRGKRGRER